MSEDPLGLSGGDDNYYRYVENSPTYFEDPYGLYSSSGNDCETRALNEYFSQLEIDGLDACETKLEKEILKCDRIADEKSGRELTSKQRKAKVKEFNEFMNEQREAGRKEARRELKKIRDEILKGWR